MFNYINQYSEDNTNYEVYNHKSDINEFVKCR